MKASVEIDVTRDLALSLLTAYAKQSLPSAMLGLFAQALDHAAEQKGPEDAGWMCHVATQLRNLRVSARALEDAIYLGERDYGALNVEDVSLPDWIAAAALDWKALPVAKRLEHIAEWEAGVDPTEIRASKP